MKIELKRKLASLTVATCMALASFFAVMNASPAFAQSVDPATVAALPPIVPVPLNVPTAQLSGYHTA